MCKFAKEAIVLLMAEVFQEMWLLITSYFVYRHIDFVKHLLAPLCHVKKDPFDVDESGLHVCLLAGDIKVVTGL